MEIVATAFGRIRYEGVPLSMLAHPFESEIRAAYAIALKAEILVKL